MPLKSEAEATSEPVKRTQTSPQQGIGLRAYLYFHSLSSYLKDDLAAGVTMLLQFLGLPLSVPIGSTGSLLDIASQLLESQPRASLIVLGSNARRNVLE